MASDRTEPDNPQVARGRADWRAWLPSRGNVLFVLVVAGALLFYVRTAGAVPGTAPTAASTQVIPYQGRLADTGGTPLSGSYAMTYKLYNVVSGGSALWTETWTGGSSVAVSNGLFNVLLGSLTPIPQTVFTANSSLWLGITVGADSEMSPRVQLGSAPFAVQALTVPKGAITYDKLSLPNGSACLPTPMVFGLPGSYTTVPITDSIVSLSLPISATVLVWASGRTNINPANGYVGTSIFLDGAQTVGTNSIYPANTGWQDWAVVRQTVIGPGNHQLDLRAFSQDPTTATYEGDATIPITCLQYLVVSN